MAGIKIYAQKIYLKLGKKFISGTHVDFKKINKEIAKFSDIIDA